MARLSDETNQPGNLTVWIVRHGERADHADPHWSLSLDGQQAPYNPPLTDLGLMQAHRTGSHLRLLGAEANTAGPRMADDTAASPLPWAVTDGAYATATSGQTAARYLVLASPFERCIQTAHSLAAGLRGSSKHDAFAADGAGVHVRVEPALAEWHTELYYDTPVPDEMLERAQARHPTLIDKAAGPPIASQLPPYPESLGGLRDRVRHVLGKLADRAADGRLQRACTPSSSAKSTLPRRIDLGLVPASRRRKSVCPTRLVWLVVGDTESNTLVSIKRVTLQRSLAMRLKFSPHRPGKLAYKLYFICDSYLGCDQEYDIELEAGEPLESEDESESEEEASSDEEMEDVQA
ncbi:histidine phosphatase superfamily [Thamnocephalis sphaerospora]|uniref:Histidine phosphatase superfamily n=1 Tax=Thamnocephalis sphaerospora TaxID=78915 RepID=A0A4P9XKE0_9FUNG|nr:histidine phosphatase superfamily [Thamnocephalis sphaerospora]|eukprot:RKP06267.1 histidine phosphatase superfamily [Thamnocephalis sphaerospora]